MRPATCDPLFKLLQSGVSWLMTFIISSAQLLMKTAKQFFQFKYVHKIKSIPNAIKTIHDIPGPSPSLPLIGTGWIYMKWLGPYSLDKLHEAHLDKYRLYGPIVKEEYQWGCPVITLYRAEDFRTIFRNQGPLPCRPASHYLRDHRRSDPKRYPNVGLANMVGNEWLSHRKKLAPVFMGKSLANDQIKVLNVVGNSMVGYIDYQCATLSLSKVINIQDLFYRYTVESIMLMTVNKGLDSFKISRQFENSDDIHKCQDDATQLVEAAKAFFSAQQELYYGLPLWKYFSTRAYDCLRKSQDLIHDIAERYIDRALTELRSNHRTNHGHNHRSVLETLLNVSQYSEAEIKCTITDFIGGGIFTATNALSMLLYNLARNPAVQEKLYQEIRAMHLNEESDEITLDTLNKMSYLKACMKESFRLTPTVPGIARITSSDMELSGYFVPKDTLVFCNHMVTCASTHYFEEPHEFKPERWLSPEKNKINLFAMLPFGYGPRMCIGWRFAEHEMLIAVAKIIGNFRVYIDNTVKSTQDLRLRLAFIVIPEVPIELGFAPRKHSCNLSDH